MINYLIIDDEHIAHDIIKGYCDILPNLEFAKSCYDAIEALQFLNKNTVGLIFLDINMPKLKGFDFLKSLQHPPKIIVTTAYKEHAIEGFELNVIDYLLKPFSFERFVKAINKVKENSTEISTQKPKSINKKDTVFIKSDKKQIQAKLSEILYVEANGNYCKVYMFSETIVTRSKISDFFEKLQKNDFFQVHKSFIVAKKHINFIEGNCIKIGLHIIPIGKLYKKSIDVLLK
ncbi:LytR/AlgR family response regulator transcription factor [Polaribacter porphyrae]|uniref:DNA-binding response regulator n=1 Tax=Polaribacter porphyrae TaxID=1137780 RepID=A0A2S7WPC1_9FLAO|nr:LytTR family DNA-binding domain-containing protein [Polaribacter porphyrae]PQJ79434.1 DNA-binding response regulator [Polaribacter porphyrae]